jgi:biopolymer transport protein ExbD
MPRERRRDLRGIGGRARLALSITPMIDVVFLLLVYFVVTTGFGSEERLLRSEGTPSADAAQRSDARPTDALELEEEPLVIRLERVDAGVGGSNGGSTGVTRIVLPAGLARVANAEQLEGVLRDAMLTAERPRGLFAADHPVRIAPARDVPWEDVVGVFRSVMGAGYRSVAFGGGG